MKLALSRKEIKLLHKIGINIDFDYDYSEDEIDDILDEVYFNESTNVEYNDKLANEFANLADNIERIRK